MRSSLEFLSHGPSTLDQPSGVADRLHEEDVDAPRRTRPVVGEVPGFGAVVNVRVAADVSLRDVPPVEAADAEVLLRVDVTRHLDRVLHLQRVVEAEGAGEIIHVADEDRDQIGRAAEDRLEVTRQRSFGRSVGARQDVARRTQRPEDEPSVPRKM